MQCVSLTKGGVRCKKKVEEDYTWCSTHIEFELPDEKVVYFSEPEDPFFAFSNYYPAPIEIGGETWPTTEHYFQAMKFSHPEYMEIIRLADTPNKAKLLGTQTKHRFGGKWAVSKDHPELGTLNEAIDKHKNTVSIIGDWEEIKDEVMLEAIRAKFEQHPDLADLLLCTGDTRIEERTKSDSYWGVVPKKGKPGQWEGKNVLGELLMKVREELS